MTTDPCAKEAETMDAWGAEFEKPEFQRRAAYSVNEPETIEPSHFINVGQTTFCEHVNDEVENQLADPLYDSIASAVAETFMDAIQLATDSVAS